MATIAVLGTMDTKGEEHGFLADLIRKRGHTPLIVNAGVFGAPTINCDVSNDELAGHAGVDLAEIRARNDRGVAVEAMARAAAIFIPRLAAEGKIHGIVSLGGGGGTAIGTAAMRGLPIGFPKLMVSTLASGNTSQYVQTKDIVFFPSVVDVSGLNRISRVVFTRAAGAICGMVESVPPPEQGRPLIVASMFGNTTKCVDYARRILEAAGYEVLVFHATGMGGRTMEALIETGLVAGVLDLTTTEWADEIAGGFLTAGPTRLEAAGKTGTPAVVAPGCLDMVNFYAPSSVPSHLASRLFYQHNPQVTLMRTSVEECKSLGQVIAAKLNAYTGPVSVIIPTRGVSVIGAPGGPFHDEQADNALFSSLCTGLRYDIPVIKMDNEINDPEFAQKCAEALLNNIALKQGNRSEAVKKT